MELGVKLQVFDVVVAHQFAARGALQRGNLPLLDFLRDHIVNAVVAEVVLAARHEEELRAQAILCAYRTVMLLLIELPSI